MTIKTVAVFNASSRQGLAQLRQLLAEGYEPVAITRNRAVIEAAGLGEVRTVAADNADPASLDAALAGVDAVFFQLPLLETPDRLVQFAGNVAEAALRAHVQRFIHNSTMWSPDDACGEVTYDTVRVVERRIEASGLPYTILRPTLFMDNWLTAYALPLLRDERLYRYPHNPELEFSPISLDDVAKFMVAVLPRTGLIGERLRIAGPETLRPEDVRALLSDAIGAPITYEYQPPADFAADSWESFVKDTGAPRDAFIAGFGAFYTFNNNAAERPFVYDVAPLLERLPVKLERFADWAKRQDWTGADQVGSVTR
jgi:uncharacterized protein YbjT (DUF2867 family)